MTARRRFPVVREHTGDPSQERQQAERHDVERFLNRVPWLDGRLIDGSFSAATQKGDGTGPGITIGVTDTLVEHGLGREPRGFFVVSMEGNAAAVVKSLASAQPTDQRRIFALVASASTLVKLWVW